MRFNLNAVRAQFGALNQQHNGRDVCFFDGPGGSQVPLSVLEAMQNYLGHYNANLGGHYFSSRKTDELMASARSSAKALLNAESADNVVFGANMTSLTFSLSRAISRNWQQGDEVIVTALDHYSNVSSWQQAAEDKDVKVLTANINSDESTLDVTHLLSLMNEKTRLVAVTLASNATGSIVDVEPIIKKAREYGAQVFIDAVHYAPHHLVDVQQLGCDFLVCSAYKFFGPHVGIAYVAPKWLHTLLPYKVEPATNIGPGRFETGTQSFEALAGLVAAVDYLAQWGNPESSLRDKLVQSYAVYNQHEQALSDHFLQRVNERTYLRLWGINDSESSLRTPTFALTFERHSPMEIARYLAEFNICVWSGHFYALGVIRQLGLEESGGVVRIGMMHYNTIEEIDGLFAALDALY